ncbi:unnamed protein product [Amoebophrya sp. A120]|nr:unnamed protein product [Amoebophrya sp. A120]|eukprot:GSA120T00003650001.1
MTSLGIPAKILHESIGHTVTVEVRDGRVFRGHLMHCEDNFNCMLEGCSVVDPKHGVVTVMEQVYVRGQSVRHFILPDMLASCPMFGARGQGYGRGTIAPLKGSGGKYAKGKMRGKAYTKRGDK